MSASLPGLNGGHGLAATITGSNGQSTGDANNDRQVLSEILGLHARVLRSMPLVQTLIVMAIAVTVWPYASPLAIAGWSVAMIAIESARAWFANSRLVVGRELDPYRTQTTFVTLAALAGAAMGVSALIFFPGLPILRQTMVVLVHFAVASGAVAVAASSRPILAAYMLTMLSMTLVAWSLQYPDLSLVAVCTASLYCVFMLWIAREGERLLTRSVAIREQHDRLVHDLEHSNAVVREAMTQAERSAESRAQVLAAASHDLRQPLHALSLYSAVLAENPSTDTLKEVGQNIDQIVRSLGSLLGGLLDLSRLSTGYYVVDRKVFALDPVIDDICSECHHTATAKGLELRRRLEPLRLQNDAIAVARIARNLIDNALKYTDTGRVEVSLNRVGTSAVLTISDTGKGIDPAEQDRVFEEFYQIDNPGRDRSKGVGLGLAIVQRLCELIDARITLDSTPGLGTTFTVVFPNAAVDPAPESAEVPARTVQPLTGKRIFVVDDEIDILKSMSVLLHQWGALAETAETAAATELLFLRYGRPDLMIADLRLAGDEHGAALADRLLRQHGPFPVLITTGETSSEALRSANEAGFSLLQKPITQEVLRHAMDALLAG